MLCQGCEPALGLAKRTRRRCRSPSPIKSPAIRPSVRWLSSICRDRAAKISWSELASVRIATTERVKRSVSLRRVRPNISQARPISASGPVRIATHCAIPGLDSGWSASARPADQAV